MFALKGKVCLGYSSGRIVLLDSANELPNRFLSPKSSFIFIAIINIENEMERYRFLVNNNIAKDLLEAKRKVNDFIPTVKDYLYDIDDSLGVDFNKIRKVNIEQYTKNLNLKNSNGYRLDFPTKIVWIPTWRCNRSCLYCGVAKIKPGQHEDRLPIKKVYKMMEELVSRGVNSISVHGGEPLFHYGSEIFDVIKFLTSNGVNDIIISTKNHISKEYARKIKESGLRKIQLSLDSTDEILLEKIYEEKEYLSKFQTTVENLQAENIKINVNIVASKLNYNTIPKLLEYLNNLLINTVSISPYRKGPVNLTDYTLSDEAQDWLRTQIADMSNTFVFDKISGSISESSKVPADDRAVCEAGRMSLLFLPDGKACYCDYLSENETFRFGNIANESVEDIWYSEKLVSFLNPELEQFKGTSCYDCNEREKCVQKGICFLKTSPEHIFSPDYTCCECK